MLRNSLHIVSALLCLVLLAPPAVAAPQADPDQEIDLSLRDADLLTVLESFAAIAGGSLDAGPAVAGTVTIELNAVPWRQALDQVCRTHGLSCYWSNLDGPELVVRQSDGFRGSGHSISMGLRGADLQQTLMAMSAMAGDDFTIEVDPAVSGEVSLELASTPWPVALEEICRNANCVVTWGQGSALVSPTTTETKTLRPAAPQRAELWVDQALTREIPDLDRRIEALRGSSGRQPVAGFDALCEMAGCSWQLHWGGTPRLEFEPRSEPDPALARVPKDSSLPTFGVEPIALRVTLQTADGVETSRDLRLGWGKTNDRVGFATDQGSAWLTVTWLPFSPQLRVMLPFVMHCDPDGRPQRVSVFEPRTVPLDVGWSEVVAGTVVSLHSLETAEVAEPVRAEEKTTRTLPNCVTQPVTMAIEVENLADGSSSQMSSLEALPGNFLMVRPPPAWSEADAGHALGALVYLGPTVEDCSGLTMVYAVPGPESAAPQGGAVLGGVVTNCSEAEFSISQEPYPTAVRVMVH